MVWNKKALYLYKFLYSKTLLHTKEHKAFAYQTSVASFCWLSHCPVANQSRGDDVEFSRAETHMQ